jgi:tetratricopeptide (TPR) repeat protein
MKRQILVCLGIVAMALVSGCSMQSADDLYADGKAAYIAITTKVHRDSVAIKTGQKNLRKFLQQYPADVRVDSALFMLAYCKGGLGDRRGAAKTFIAVSRKYQDSPLAAKSLILAGGLQEEFRNYRQARETYARLVALFPKHEFVQNGSAKFLIKNLGKPMSAWDMPSLVDSLKAPIKTTPAKTPTKP